MSETKWTPGPWRVGFEGSATSQLAERNKDCDCPPFAFGQTVGVVCNRSDAHLIAAAPELYQALEELAEEASWSAAAVDKNGALDKALAALAKARGET